MRSSWEVAFAHWLDTKGIAWAYEPHVFELKPGVRYVPDFYLPNTDTWVEVKGRMTKPAAEKIELFRRERRLKIIDRAKIERLTGVSANQLPQMYPAIDNDELDKGSNVAVTRVYTETAKQQAIQASRHAPKI
jgi:hypothetical protein